MATSQADFHEDVIALPPTSPREDLRLALADPLTASSLAGVWWPQSHDLATEVADLVDHFPGDTQVMRVLFSRPDWSETPRSVNVGRGRLKVGSFPHDDTHLVILTMSDRTRSYLLVVPPEDAHGAEVMAHGLAGQDYRDAAAWLSVAGT